MLIDPMPLSYAETIDAYCCLSLSVVTQHRITFIIKWKNIVSIVLAFKIKDYLEYLCLCSKHFKQAFL